MADEELPDRSGTLLADRYRLTKRLGAGGMGEVYRAVNEMVNREVAIKVLKPEYARSPDVVQRVLREARAANAVRHPNVVDVLDVATDAQGAPIIVQELLNGVDLAEHLRGRGVAFTEPEVLEVMIPVSEAVGAAHRAGIMHRDLKLENIFLHRTTTGAVVPKVLDFGLSRHIGEDAVSRLTATGVAMGTPMYMSPEQVQGERDIDQRTDVWALGIMLYELTAGRLPFGGDSLGAIFVKICTVDPEPLRPLAPQISDAYAAIVRRCLQRDRSARYASAAELAADLVRLRAGVVTLDENAPRLPGLAATPRSQTPPIDAQNFAASAAVGHAQTLASAPAMDPTRTSSRSIGPAVSQVHPAPRRTGLIVAAALAACAVLGGGVWAATHRSGDPPTAAAQPPAAPPPTAVPVAPPAPAPVAVAPAPTVAPPAAPVAPADAPEPAQASSHRRSETAPDPANEPPSRGRGVRRVRGGVLRERLRRRGLGGGTDRFE
jgi:serine/threonine protein kinase